MRIHTITVITALAALAAACSDNDAPLRKEYIKVYTSSPDTLLDDIQIPFEGVSGGEIHILTNDDVTMRYMVNPALPAESRDWFTITSMETVAEGHVVIRYDAASILGYNTLARRAGTLSVTDAQKWFGKFVGIRQGYVQVYEDNFDDRSGGDVSLTGLMTYSTSAIGAVNTNYYDYVSFNAFAESSSDVTGQNLTLDVSVSGGAVFDAIGRSSIRLNVPLADSASADNFRYVLLSNGGERMSASTSLTFSCSNPSGETVHIDNLAVYKVSEAELEDLADDEEDFSDDENW